MAKIVESRERRVLEDLGECCDARMFRLVHFCDLNSHFERTLFVVEKVVHLLLEVLFLEAKSEPIVVRQFVKEFLLVGEAEGVSSKCTNHPIVGQRDSIGGYVDEAEGFAYEADGFGVVALVDVRRLFSCEVEVLPVVAANLYREIHQRFGHSGAFERTEIVIELGDKEEPQFGQGFYIETVFVEVAGDEVVDLIVGGVVEIALQLARQIVNGAEKSRFKARGPQLPQSRRIFPVLEKENLSVFLLFKIELLGGDFIQHDGPEGIDGTVQTGEALAQIVVLGKSIK